MTVTLPNQSMSAPVCVIAGPSGETDQDPRDLHGVCRPLLRLTGLSAFRHLCVVGGIRTRGILLGKQAF